VANPFDRRDTTLPVDEALAPPPAVRRFKLTVVEGPGAGRAVESDGDRLAIGLHPSNELTIDDPTVSRFHCEVRVEGSAARVRDLGSRNGTFVDGVEVSEAKLRDGSLLRVGKATVRFELATERNRLPVSQRTSFGSLVGTSVALRTCFSLLERAAGTDFTVLLEGETGTGKGDAAEAIHAASARRDKRFVVVDCGAIPENLLESELFGHEKGAFTGAEARRVGAFEEADGGTIFLDEIGELPLELQPKLLRALENGEIRRVGSNSHRPVDVRVVAATHRDLRAEVNAGRFRHDLYFRVAVLRVTLPPLRERPEDIPLIVDAMLERLEADEAQKAALRAPAFRAALQRAAWPGNVRELRNHLERSLVWQEAPLDDDGGAARTPDAAAAATATAPAGAAIDVGVTYAEGRRRALDAFERAYVQGLVAAHDGSVAKAAQAAGVTRVHLYRLLRRHGIKI